MFLLYVLQQSQAEAHYKGNRHARRVKGIETSKSRPQEGDKPHTVPPTSSPSPTGASGTAPDNEPSKAGKRAHNRERRTDRKGVLLSFIVKAIILISARCSELIDLLENEMENKQNNKGV